MHLRPVRLLSCLVSFSLLANLPLNSQSDRASDPSIDANFTQGSVTPKGIDHNFLEACHADQSLGSSTSEAAASLLLHLSGVLPPQGLNLHGTLTLSATDHVLANGFSVNIGRQQTHFFAGRALLRNSYSRSIVFPAQLAALIRDDPNDTQVTWSANAIRVAVRGNNALHRHSELFQLSMSAAQNYIDSIAICRRPERPSGNYELGLLFFSNYISTENGLTPLSVRLSRGSEPPVVLKMAE